jgi:hypothetical protein
MIIDIRTKASWEFTFIPAGFFYFRQPFFNELLSEIKSEHFNKGIIRQSALNEDGA